MSTKTRPTVDGDKTIAIIGLGARLPGAMSVDTFWDNVQNKVYAIQDNPPADRWDPELYYDPDPNAPDKTYSKIGGWTSDFEFDRKRYRIPPMVIQSMDPTQQMALETVHEALGDSGYLEKDFNRENCAVILGNAMGGDLRDRTNLRVAHAEFDMVLRQVMMEMASGKLSQSEMDELSQTVEKRFKDMLPTIDEDSMPGELANVVAGRVASQFNLRGPNYISDAACASSLAAVEQAVRGLQIGTFDMAVTGGVDRCMGAPTYVKFAKIGALSPDGSRPFDADANGFVMGEGGAILILKRLNDAIRDGDNIYATIRGVGASSDGRGKGITAPNPTGQQLAYRRAYEDAGYGPKTVTLQEAHGTSTPVGDPSEINSLRAVFEQDASSLAADKISIGSLKSMIGHLKAAAGAASMVKTALALKHGVLPPTLNVETPNPKLHLDNAPFRIQHETETWAQPAGAPRRAGVSAFGFGGTNFHVTMEEWQEDGSTARIDNSGQKETFSTGGAGGSGAQQASAEPHEDGILTFTGSTVDEVSEAFAAFAADFEANGLAATTAHRLPLEHDDLTLPNGGARLAVSYTSEEGLQKQVERTTKAFNRGRGWRILANQGIYLSDEVVDGKISMLFPGQGTQYTGMLAELKRRYSVVQETFDEADEIMEPVLGRPLSDIIFPEESGMDEDEAREMLKQTENTQPAVLTADIALLRLLQTFGVEPDMVAGHSLGEYGACVAAGVMSFPDALRTVAQRGTQMAKASPLNGDNGLMASIPEDADTVQAVLDQVDGYVVCANKNCPRQTIIAGLTKPVEEAVAIFEEQGNMVHMLEVSHAFHSKVVAEASEPLREHLDQTDIFSPSVDILTNVTGGFYPRGDDAPDKIRDLLAEQVASPVEFIKEVDNMYDSGARIFIECGPKRAQTSFVDSILADKDIVSMYTNHPKDGDVGSIHNALARLWSIGAWTNATRSKQPSPTASNDTGEESHTQSPVPTAPSAALSRSEVLDTMLSVLCEKTGYDPDEIEFDFELEADLGIDTVKQAEIMADVREGFSLPKDENFRLADYPTLEKMADYVLAQLENTDSAPAEAATETPETSETTETTEDTATEPQSPVPTPQSPALSRSEVLDTMLSVLCEKTGYDPDEIEFDFELEADLGIDTVKQAEIMADVREGFSLPKDENFRLADYPTLEKMADYVLAQLENTDSAPAEAATETPETSETTETTEDTATEPQSPVPTPQSPALSRSEVLDTMLSVLCEKTGYDPDEIEFDFELEADLGIDTVKQAEIMADVREGFSLPKDENFRLADYPTLEKMADYVLAQLENTDSAPAEAATETPETTETTATTEDTATEPQSPVPTPQSPALSRSEVLDTMLSVLCEKTGYDPDEIEFDFELEADLGIDTVKQAEIMADVREGFSLPKDENFRLADYPTLEKMADYVLAQLENTGTDAVASPEPTTTHLDAPQKAAAKKATKSGSTDNDVSVVAQGDDEAVHTEHSIPAGISITGSALGLPGSQDLFDGEAVERLLSGQNMIGDIPREIRQEIVDKHITRLQKHKDGGGELVEVEDIEEVLKLAGRGGDFDLEEEWGISKRMVEQLDKTSQMAIAAGFNALRDAGLPLVPRYRETRSGKKLTIGWQLPEDIGKDTGVIFASAFAGADALAEEIKKRYTEEDYQFNHRFLVRVLGIANARFAEMIGARGPNTRMNNACASTTTAIGMAEDWIKTGRCKRVVIVSADDASGDHLMDWVGSGFLATGAATTESDVEKAALPFDKRRHGMIIGMGAMSLVVEQGGLAEERGIEPLVDVLGTHFVNSAYHPTRLDVGHIAGEVGELLGRVEGDFDLSREDIAERTVFVSHETYTPARGGSADAEISALRDNFGDAANKVVIANTKGFTGHAMGAGIEEVLAVKALQNQRIPHIANFQEPDPNLGDLRLSEGGEYELDYALRLAAGFGSQLALSVFRYRARTENRLYDADRYAQWLSQVSGYDNFELTVEDRTLRVVESQPEDRPTPPNDGGGKPATSKQETTSTPTPAPEPQAPTKPAQPVRLAGEGDVDETVDASTFEPRPVVVEAHTAATYDLLDLRERLSGSNIVVVGGPLLVTNTMVRALERCGANVRSLEDSTDRSPLDDDDSVVNLTDESAIKRELDALGQVDGVINLLGYGKDRDSNEDVHRASRATFHLARAWKQHLGKDPDQEQFFLSITGMGGRLGFDRSTQPMPAAGAVGGLTKALGREWNETHVRVVDVAREGFYPDLGLQILAEVFADAPSLEVGLIAGVRYVPVIVDAEDIYGHREEDNSYAPGEDSVVMVVGGAKGITAEVCVDLANRFGCKLALVGRSSLDHDDPLSIDMDAEKAKAKERIEARGDRVTPVAVQDELWPLKSQIKIAENMERMRAAGSDVAYFSCDVADQDSVEALFDEVAERFGKVDGIIHAAGVEESKFLDDKTPESFDKVFCGKALGGLNLWRVAKDHDPSFFMAFSSVAGRFGNAGQVDYSSANEVLGKLVAKINATSDTHGLIIDWTAWDEVGMATAGSMRTILEHRGVEFLPPAIGAPLVGDAMERGLVGEVLVAGELGEMAGGDDVLERSATKEERVSFEQEYVFVDRVAERDADEKLVVQRVFDPERDYFLNDHIYQGVPVLPGVMGYEFMVETAKELVGDDLASVEDVSFERAVKFHHGEPLRVIATAEVIDTADGTTSVAVKLETEREAKTGRTLRHEHFTATVNFGDEPAQPDAALELDPMATYLRGPNKLEIYKRFFHTGRFQVMESLPHVGDDAIIGYGRNPTGRLTASQNGHVFLTDPMVREMAFQTVGLWGMKRNELSYLPYKIGAARQYGTARPGEGINVRCKRRDDASEHAIAFDVEVRAQDGRLLQVMEKVELIGHRRLEASENFSEFPTRRMTVRRLSYPEAEMLLNDAGLEPDDVLVDEERESFERLISDRRRSEWLAARVAAKDLVACHLRNFYGVRPALSEVVVRKDDNGAPYIELRGEAARLLPDAELPPTTITHSHGVAIAGIAAPGEPSTVGIDLEVIETRNDSFAKNYFTDDERALDVPADLLGSDDDPRSTLLTLLWSVKESVSKALGLGLNLKLGEVLVTGLSKRGEDVIAEVELRERAEDAYAELGGRSLEVCAKLDGTFALSLAWLELAESIDQSQPVTVRTKDTTKTEPKTVTPENWAEHAAVAALLKHKGLLKQTTLGDAKVKGEDISPWKA